MKSLGFLLRFIHSFWSLI